MFEVTLGVSATTGYNWSKTSSVAKNEQKQYEVEATAPAGTILEIKQVVGHCDGSIVSTEKYKISHLSATRSIISEHIVHELDS